MKTLLLILLASLLAQSAEARLGETAQEIGKRYGAPTRPLTNSMYGLTEATYQLSEYLMTVYFKDRKSVKEDIKTKLERKPSEEECLALAETVGGAGWIQVGFSKVWKRPDGSSVWVFGDELEINSAEYNRLADKHSKAAEEARKQQDRQKASGF